MEIKIGVKGAGRELELDVELDESQIQAALLESLNSDTPLQLSDKRGSNFLIPARAIAYVQIAPKDTRRVGFSI